MGISIPYHEFSDPLSKTDKNIRVKLPPAQKEFIYALPVEMQYHCVYTDSQSGCSVYRHILVKPDKEDYEQVFAVAQAYAKECDCWINPEIHSNAPMGREKIYPGLKGSKGLPNPDLYTKVYGYIDVKSPHRKNNIVRNANHACMQAAIVVVTDFALNEPLSTEEMEKFTGRIFSDKNVGQDGQLNYSKEEVHWLVRGCLVKCNRPKKK